MTPDISVIIPTCRRPGPLAEAIETSCQREARPAKSSWSTIAQNAAPRRSRAVTRARASPTCTLPFPHAAGLPWSAIKALKSARADIIHFLDDDDLAPEGYYAEALQVFAQRPDIGVVFGKVAPFGEVDVASERDYFDAAWRRARRYSHLGPKLGLAAAMFFQQTLLICSAGMVRKSCVEAIGGFDLEPIAGGGRGFLCAAIRHSGAVVLDRTSIHYRIGPSLMRLPDRQPLIESSYRSIHERYRREHGAVDYFALKTFARILDRLHA